MNAIAVINFEGSEVDFSFPQEENIPQGLTLHLSNYYEGEDGAERLGETLSPGITLRPYEARVYL